MNSSTCIIHLEQLSFYHSCQIFYLCMPLCRLDYSSVSWRVFAVLSYCLLHCMYLLLQHFKTQIVSVAPRCQTGGGGSKNVVLVPRYYKALVLSALFIQTLKIIQRNSDMLKTLLQRVSQRTRRT